MCELDILIVIKDRETQKIIEYCSGDDETSQFTLHAAMAAKNSGNFQSIVYNDQSYDLLVPSNKLKMSSAQNGDQDEELLDHAQAGAQIISASPPQLPNKIDLLANTSLKIQKIELPQLLASKLQKVEPCNIILDRLQQQS